MLTPDQQRTDSATTHLQGLRQATDEARARYAAANPGSREADQAAEQHMPGGNTRSVLHYEPFPLTIVRGVGGEVIDLDGHRYLDFVGEYSAGLFGHSDEAIKAAIREGLEVGVVMGAPTPYERQLARLICQRFPSIEHVRFCNSGTEANLLALTTARIQTGREKIMVFDGAYHGGVIKFPDGNSRFNVPFDYLVAEYNNVDKTEALLRQGGDQFAAVIVEPILGAGGNISGSAEFMQMLRRVTRELGALLIFDEVKTARLGRAGAQGILGIEPDLTTLGKFIAGGLPTGAFGGKARTMAVYNPKQAGAWNHAGTFNNNVCSMAAGVAAMGTVYTAARAAEFFEMAEAFRTSLNEMFAAKDVSMHANGQGSIFAIHFARQPVTRKADITAGCLALRPLLHMEMLLEGILICKRGDFFPSLPMNETHFAATRAALGRFVDRYRPLIHQVLEAPG